MEAGWRTFLTGTTFECAMEIMRDGCFSTDPPNRVWKGYSEKYVYFIDPLKVATYYEPDEFMERSVILAADQAASAIWEFDHTRRVVFEVSLPEGVVSDDCDCGDAVKYPYDVPFSYVTGIYVERRNMSRRIKESVALARLFREYDEWMLHDPNKRKSLLEEIKYLSLVHPIHYVNPTKRYDDLVDEQGSLNLFTHMSREQFIQKYSKKSA